MSIQTRLLQRAFSYMGLQLVDPDPALTPEQVRDAYCTKSQNQNLLASF